MATVTPNVKVSSAILELNKDEVNYLKKLVSKVSIHELKTKHECTQEEAYCSDHMYSVLCKAQDFNWE